MTEVGSLEEKRLQIEVGNLRIVLGSLESELSVAQRRISTLEDELVVARSRSDLLESILLDLSDPTDESGLG